MLPDLHCATIGAMSLSSLYLAPDDPQSAPDLDGPTVVLQDLGLIGRPLAPKIYSAGEGFSRHVIYAGCSPFLAMQPSHDGSLQFCHVALHGPYAQPRLVTGPGTARPRCPTCRARLTDWREQLEQWQAGTTRPLCPGCGRSWSAHELDWRAHAISGRVLIELRNVFPGEASPSDLLLQRLEGQTGTPWRYAWAPYLNED
ncbi:MAG: hypothetical protein KDI67_06570 [Gammaproteobacteria bacterium]|nr:hypothetical protein [Gammaproteobacteria bacterium]